MWALRKKLKAGSWAKMMKRICQDYKKELEEFEWL